MRHRGEQGRKQHGWPGVKDREEREKKTSRLAWHNMAMLCSLLYFHARTPRTPSGEKKQRSSGARRCCGNTQTNKHTQRSKHESHRIDEDVDTVILLWDDWMGRLDLSVEVYAIQLFLCLFCYYSWAMMWAGKKRQLWMQLTHKTITKIRTQRGQGCMVANIPKFYFSLKTLEWLKKHAKKEREGGDAMGL